MSSEDKSTDEVKVDNENSASETTEGKTETNIEATEHPADDLYEDAVESQVEDKNSNESAAGSTEVPKFESNAVTKPEPDIKVEPEADAQKATDASEKEQGGGFSLFGLKIGGESTKKLEPNPPENQANVSNESNGDGGNDKKLDGADADTATKDSKNSPEAFSLFGVKIGGESKKKLEDSEKENEDVKEGEGEGEKKGEENAAGEEGASGADNGDDGKTDEPKKEALKGGLFGLFAGSKKEEKPIDDAGLPDEEKGEVSKTEEAKGEGQTETEAGDMSKDDSNLKRKESMFRPVTSTKAADPKQRGGAARKYTLLCLLCVASIVVILAVLLPLLMTAERAVVGLSKEGRESGDGLNHHTKEALIAQIAKHPLYAGPLFPFGKVTLRFDDDNRFLAVLGLEGLETTCIDCRWTILEGKTCANSDELGSTELYDRSVGFFQNGATPYTAHALYNSQDGKSFSSAAIWNGYGFEDIEEHAVVIFQQTGAPLGCGVLKRHGHPLSTKKLWANMASLPAYSGAEISGRMKMEFFSDDSWHIDTHLEGLPAQCFACGIHIHEGTSCNEPAGNDFWNSDKIVIDPWHAGNGAYYSSDVNGTTDHSFYLYTGYPYDEHFKRVIILYDQNGLPIGCGELWNTVSHQPQIASTPSNERREKMLSGRRIDFYGEDKTYEQAGEKIIVDQASNGDETGMVEVIQV